MRHKRHTFHSDIRSGYLNKKKQNRVRVLGVVLGLTVVLCSGVLYTQRGNIQALRYATTASKSEIDTMIDEQDERIASALDNAPDALKDKINQDNIDKIVEEQKKNQPDVTQPTVKPDISVVQPEPATPEPTNPEPTKSELEQPSQEELDAARDAEKIEVLVAELYVMKDYYIDKLDALEKSAIARVMAMPAKDRNKDNLFDMGMEYLREGTSLERKADEDVKAIVDQVDALVKAHGGDGSLAKEIYAAYENEKTLKKAQYISKYSEHLT